ncbi:MAG TPA: PRC-barrel domain-containing protein [Polyangiaceae bacterium LLY-WYZ-15_(1-7)]|nr:hypothetical protein [Myxococcales bacterium]MAT27420.1 hypothetical protein [Sandaracinus sp.]HJK89251.1 PRC-barrel domain-containing protein [Polyangiaceae bacterium LLY-WYZ-15_(1-7)]MBJ74568.1 hypothetical protein [Sandaracinus sp.]HJL05573.1 PRC-barrel domain-containing protein [Polyangiaceae bacterium LLY-WYZ-15_(1-7)]
MNDAQMKHRDLVGKTVFTQDGHELGEIAGLVVDVGSWRVPALDVRLERKMLERLHLEKPMFGSQTVRIGVEKVSGIGDTVVLKSKLEELAFADTDGDGVPDPPEGAPEKE